MKIGGDWGKVSLPRLATRLLWKRHPPRSSPSKCEQGAILALFWKWNKKFELAICASRSCQEWYFEFLLTSANHIRDLSQYRFNRLGGWNTALGHFPAASATSAIAGQRLLKKGS